MTTGTKRWTPNEADEELKAQVLQEAPQHARIAPTDVELLKQTRSVCPTCYRVIAADVGIEDDQVWMYKACPEHGPVRGLVESNVPFYRTTMNAPPIKRPPYHTLIIPITHRCNLNCPLCYVPKRGRDDLTTDDILRLVDKFPGKVIALSGGEPTLREDLPKIIRHVRSGDRGCRMLSNAIKLADRDYCAELAEAGLQYVLFSFNGFDDAIYEQTNRKPLLDLKLAALENCVANRIEVALSPTIFRGLNEDQIGPIIRLCLEHAPCVSQLRIRGACRVGRHGTFAPLSTYELFKHVAKALGRTVEDFLGEMEPDKMFHSTNQFHMLAAFMKANLRGNRKDEFYDWNAGEWYVDEDDFVTASKAFHKKVCGEVGRYVPKGWVEGAFKFLHINTWGWPDASNFDFQEIGGHGLYHLYDNRLPMNFFEAVLHAEDL